MKSTVFTLFILTFFCTNTFSGQKSKTGVLILAHGGSDTWNNLVYEAVEPIQEKYHVAIAFGMANPKTLQKGISELEEKRIQDIVVVPLFISSHSFIIRQTEYFLGKRDKLEDPLILMDHSGSSSDHGIHEGDGTDHKMVFPQQIKTSCKIYITPALDDHGVVANILNQRIKSLSTSPAQETIIIVGHGPNPEKDNRNWIAKMESLGRRISDLNEETGVAYKNIFAVTVRDDASKEIYDIAKENLRSLIRQSSANSTVIVVPLLLSKGGIEKGIVQRMEGLDYLWSGETILPDPLIADFIIESIKLVGETR